MSKNATLEKELQSQVMKTFFKGVDPGLLKEIVIFDIRQSDDDILNGSIMFDTTVRIPADSLSKGQFDSLIHTEEDNVKYAIAHDHSFGHFRLDARNDDILVSTFAHFKDLTQCNANFTCPGAAYKKVIQPDKFTCICQHVCSGTNCGENGDCVFDEIIKAKTCKCKTSTLSLYYGDQCETSTLKFEVVLGISVGAALVLILVIFLVIVCRCRNRKSDKSSMSYDPREWDLPSETETGKPQNISYRAWSTRSSIFGDRYYRHFPSHRKYESDAYDPFSLASAPPMQTSMYFPPANEYDTDGYSVGGASAGGVASGRGGANEGGARGLSFIDPSQDYSIVRPQVDQVPREIYRPFYQNSVTDNRGMSSQPYTDSRTAF
ncbi:uncharacterized protein [Argopecten irradians]|uniref:uncharacterized protein n=1 Tax=Argopecten irradians TaxID=31199 RepID=UPI00371E63D5